MIETLREGGALARAARMLLKVRIGMILIHKPPPKKFGCDWPMVKVFTEIEICL